MQIEIHTATVVCFFIKIPKIHIGGKRASSTNSAGETGLATGGRLKLDPYLSLQTPTPNES